MKKATVFFVCLVMLAMLVACGTAAPAASPTALNYPTRQISLICPYDPGGATDSLVRVIAAMMTDKLGQPCIVENIPGAGTMLAANVLQQRPADGYAIVGFAAAATPWILSVMSETTPPWKPEDFTLVCQASSSPAAASLRRPRSS